MALCYLYREFVVGRLSEGQYEYSKLNGWMTPQRAKKRCDRDVKCGGFTYKGFITNDPTQEFRVFFFHLVLNFEDDIEVWNWVTYKAERSYIQFDDIIDPKVEFYSTGKKLTLSQAEVKSF